MIDSHLDQQHVGTATARSHGPRQTHLPTNNVYLSHGDRWSLSLSQRINAVYSAILCFKEYTYSDQRGKFPGKSRKVNEYLFVLYDCDSNTIDAELFPNHLIFKIKWVYQKTLAKLQARDIQTKSYTLDNEASRLL